MEQIYMLEIFVDKLTVYLKQDENANSKNIIIKTTFGPNIHSITKELLPNKNSGEDMIEVTPSGRRQYSKIIRVGKSYLFPSYPDKVLTMLAKFPISIEVWTDDTTEPDFKLYIGVGVMPWNKKFFYYLKETADATKTHGSIAHKEVVTLYQECCCGVAGEISIILRLSALGSTIVTEFQQVMTDPERFCFRTNKTPNMVESKRIEGDNPNFCMIGSLYETTTLEDPEVLEKAKTKVEVCTEMEACGPNARLKNIVSRGYDDKPPKEYALNKIRMGDIIGPCGNSNCPLAHKVKQYIRSLDSYKAKAGVVGDKLKPAGNKKICGDCGCKDERWHREECPSKEKKVKTICSECRGTTQSTCEERLANMTEIQNLNDSTFKNDYIVENCYFTSAFQENNKCTAFISRVPSFSNPETYCYGKGQSYQSNTATEDINSTYQYVYNSEIFNNKRMVKEYKVATEIAQDTEYRCSSSNKTFDSAGVPELDYSCCNKLGGQLCSQFKCTVSEEDGATTDKDENEIDPLLYDYPAIDFKTCLLTDEPYCLPMRPTDLAGPSNTEKISCSKEFQRLKNVLKEYNM